jgi:hypothetical protein
VSDDDVHSDTGSVESDETSNAEGISFFDRTKFSHTILRLRERYDRRWGYDEAREIWARVRTRKYRYISGAGHGARVVEVRVHKRKVYVIIDDEYNLRTVITPKMMRGFIVTIKISSLKRTLSWLP